MQQVQTTLPVKSIVGERYQIEALLGKGGFGAVYLVHDLRVQQNVFALKEIIDPDHRERRHFTFEADLLKRVDHPALPRVYRSFDEPAQGRAYMLMDYIAGSNLEHLRRQQPGKRFTLPEALALIRSIFEAVAYLHAQEPPIIHRDIKPSNIIAPDSGERAVLVDFGIAKEFDQEATTTVIRHATPGYGAPEQYNAGTDTRTDVYGLGATLYALLTGTIPIDAFFRMTQKLGKQIDPLPPVQQILPTIPEHVSAAIARAMDLEKDERFANVEDFWQALQSEPQMLAGSTPVSSAFAAAPTIKVRLTRLPTPERSSSLSHARAGWLVIALLLLLIVGTSLAAALFLRPGQRGQQAHLPTATPRTASIQTVAPTATPTSQPTPTLTPTPTSQAPASPPLSVPTLSAAYTGTIHDNYGGINTAMFLKNITQNGQSISGTFYVNPPLSGNGPFTGTVKSDKTIQFTVHSSDPGANAPLFFSGKVRSDGAISGQYCSLDANNHCNSNMGGYGNWSVRPTPSGA